MACACTGVCWMIAICVLQLLATVFRQTFAFLGLLWTAIAMNFCHITAIIFAIIGCARTKPRLLAMYSAWLLIWVGWNLYLIFLYVGVGVLSLSEHLVTLNLGLSNSLPWFLEKCMIFTDMEEDTVTAYDISSISSENFPWYCGVGYQYIEVGQASVQLLLSVFGFAMSCYVIGVMREDEQSFDFVNENDKHKLELNTYSVQSQPLMGVASTSTTA